MASLGPDPALIPVRMIVESVQPLAIAPQTEALDDHQYSLFRSELTRGSDSAESLLGRLGIADAQAAARGICKLRYEAFGCAGQASKIKPLSLEKMAERYKKGELNQIVN